MNAASAPGKIVLWGEYAVLAGAPAAVLALDARATVTLEPTGDSHWHFISQGFVSDPEKVNPAALPSAGAGVFVRQILQHWGLQALEQCGPPRRVNTDSAQFFQQQQKLGLGSSAAVCTATYQALCDITGRTPNLSEAMHIHKQWQGGKGSGLDVASVWHGGLIHFRQGDAQVSALPNHWHWQVVWTGASASTPAHITKFNDWRQSADTRPLEDLAALSETLCEGPATLSDLALYQNALEALDQAAILNIFTPEHARLGTLAAACGVLYKPCGAGGGDIGMAFADDPSALAHFRQQAAANGFTPLDLETATHGVASH